MKRSLTRLLILTLALYFLNPLLLPQSAWAWVNCDYTEGPCWRYKKAREVQSGLKVIKAGPCSIFYCTDGQTTAVAACIPNEIPGQVAMSTCSQRGLHIITRCDDDECTLMSHELDSKPTAVWIMGDNEWQCFQKIGTDKGLCINLPDDR